MSYETFCKWIVVGWIVLLVLAFSIAPQLTK